MLPFTHEQFLEVFARYNLAVWPAQFFAYLLAAVMLGAIFLGASRWRDRLIAGGLALMWTWTGIAYHWLQFTSINDAAWAFGALFVLQGLLFAHAAAAGKLQFGTGVPGIRRTLGWALAGYATILYPAAGVAFGPGYPEMPMFGITPCPVTLFTFGILLLGTGSVSRWLLVIPVAWSLVGGSAAWMLNVPQDWLLLAGGATVLLIARTGRPRPSLQAQGRG
jgi:hypothetical protein